MERLIEEFGDLLVAIIVNAGMIALFITILTKVI